MEGGQKNAFEVKWRVENITSWLQTRDDVYYSPQFLAEPLMNTRWKLRLSKNRQLAEKYLCLTLQRDVDDDGPEWIPLNYELAFLACDGSHIKSKTWHKKFALKTVSHEVNAKQDDILQDKKEVYLPEGVLTVSCKLWMAWSSISKRVLCSIRSAIGTKCITLEAAIQNYSALCNCNRTVNFTSSSKEINLISFDVSVPYQSCDNNLNFKKIEIECKSFTSYACCLFALTNKGDKWLVKDIYGNIINLSTVFSQNKDCTFEFKKSYLNTPEFLINDTLTLQIDVIYFPGVQSELIEYDEINVEKMACESAEESNVSNNPFHTFPEIIQSNPSYHLKGSERDDELDDIEEKNSSDEDGCFDAAEKKPLPTTTYKEDMTSLCNDHLFCDTKLQTDTESFPAHRNVLCARSPVFKKMFTTDMKEKAGECINIPDISSDTMRRMLQFIYTDSTGDLEMQSAKDLYVASDKYDIASLKQRCLSFMKKNLCPSNVCEVLVLADMHQDKDLESAAQQFVLTYSIEVLGSNEWKLFMKDFSSLAAKVMYLKCMDG